MITVDDRCTHATCLRSDSHTSIYRMVGTCRNCGAKDILILFTARHEKRNVDCPVCDCMHTVMPLRLATPDEIPAS